MSIKYTDILERINRARSLSELRMLLPEIRDSIDLDHVVYHAMDGDRISDVSSTTYPDRWVARYRDMAYHTVDPVVKAAQRSPSAVDWRFLDWSGRRTRDFFGEAMAAGVARNGLSIPIRGPSGNFSLFTANVEASDRRWALFLQESETTLAVISASLDHKVWSLSRSREREASRPDAPNLSPRERDTLALLALGYKRGDAAERLKISDHTLRCYVDSAREKLGAENTTHAVALALQSGIITL